MYPGRGERLGPQPLIGSSRLSCEQKFGYAAYSSKDLFVRIRGAAAYTIYVVGGLSPISHRYGLRSDPCRCLDCDDAVACFRNRPDIRCVDCRHRSVNRFDSSDRKCRSGVAYDRGRRSYAGSAFAMPVAVATFLVVGVCVGTLNGLSSRALQHAVVHRHTCRPDVSKRPCRLVHVDGVNFRQQWQPAASLHRHGRGGIGGIPYAFLLCVAVALGLIRCFGLRFLASGSTLSDQSPGRPVSGVRSRWCGWPSSFPQFALPSLRLFTPVGWKQERRSLANVSSLMSLARW